MAYYNQNSSAPADSSLGMNQKKEDEQALVNGVAPAPGAAAPVQLSTASANGANTAAVPGAGVPVSNTSAPKSASSGMAGGFQAYKQANQGTATNRLTDAAKNNVAAQGQAAKTGMSQATDQFGKKVDAGTLANRFQAVQDVSNTLSSVSGMKAPVAPAPLQATATPTDRSNLTPQTTVGINRPVPYQIQTQEGGRTGTVEATTNAGTPAPAAPVDPLSQVEGLDRFKEIINTKYTGPESLRQAGLYQGAADKVNTAANTIKNAGTAGGREEMLRDMYAKRGDYTKGLNKLDSSILNSNKAGVSAVQASALAQGDLKNELEKAQLGSNNMAQNRTTEVNKIRDEARKTFSDGKIAEEQKAEGRMDAMIKTPIKDAQGNPVLKGDGTPMTQWDQLPEHYKSVIRNKATDNAASYEVKAADYAKNNAANNVPDSQLQAAQKKASQIQTLMKMKMGGSPAQYKAAMDEVNALQAKKQQYNSGLESLKNPNAVNFNAQEAEALGISQGEGLYNLGEGAIKQGEAVRSKLVSKDEQARQSVLSRMAGLDDSKTLETKLNYTDADQAGTQSIYDSLDLKGTRAAIDEGEAKFQREALANNVNGYGEKKNKTNGKTYRQNEQANLGALLQQNGYPFGSRGASNATNSDMMKNIGNVANGNSLNDAKSMVGGAVSAHLGGFTGGDSNTTVGKVGNLAGAAGLNYLTGALGFGGAGDVVDRIFNSGANTGESKDLARQFAREDLNKNVGNALNTAGFSNRVGIDNSLRSTTDANGRKVTALEQLIAGLDKTNK